MADASRQHLLFRAFDDGIGLIQGRYLQQADDGFGCRIGWGVRVNCRQRSSGNAGLCSVRIGRRGRSTRSDECFGDGQGLLLAGVVSEKLRGR